MPRRFAIFLLTVLVASLAASCQAPAADGDKVRVAASILPQVELIEAVGGDRVEIMTMVPPGANPHTYEPKPSQMAELARVRVYAKVGSGVEFELAWMDKLIGVNRDMAVIDCSRGVELLGENGGLVDPHIWMSPRNAQTMVRNIAGGLIEIDPGSRAYYERNRDAYIERLSALDGELRERLAGLENRKFIIFHPALGYLAKEYNLIEIAIEEEGKEPTAARVAEVIAEAKANNIKVIFATPQFNPRGAEIIAQSIGGRVVFIDPLAKNYIENTRAIAGELAAAMGT